VLTYQRKSSIEELESEAESSSEDKSEEEPPPKKKVKTTPKQKPKPKVSTKPHAPPPVESSDDDLPLRPGPSDAEVKSTVLEFLKSKDLTTVTKGMVKEAVRNKYGDAVLRAKKEVVAEGIEEGMEAL
jgi:DEK C terminal domain